MSLEKINRKLWQFIFVLIVALGIVSVNLLQIIAKYNELNQQVIEHNMLVSENAENAELQISELPELRLLTDKEAKEMLSK